MLYEGQHWFNKNKSTSLRITVISACGNNFAVSDMYKAQISENTPKPKVYSKQALLKLIESGSLNQEYYELASELTFTDNTISNLGRSKWLKKRDKKWNFINHLCTPKLIDKYLFGNGLNEEIKLTLEEYPERWQTTGAYYNAINRYITFGVTKNALLPFGLKNTGSNYKNFESCDSNVVKRGRGGKNNEFSRSKTRGITNRDKTNIVKVLKYFSRVHSKFTLKRAFEVYQEQYETHVLSRDSDEHQMRSYIPFELNKTISYDQFYHHAKKLLSRGDLLRLKVGNLNFEKDYKDRQGSAHDGVRGATHRYEVDATVLDIYVRYPFDARGRYTMGRPVLYLVVDVYSTLIVGFYIGFDGPNSDGVSQALVNACSDKVEFANRYGLEISENDWPAYHIPLEITTDNGSEFPDGLFESILKNVIGVIAINIAAVYRGDAKATVERKFGVINDQFIHYQAGSIFNVQRGVQHPSNHSLYDYDALVKIMITEVIYHNKSAERLKRFNWQCVVDDIDITPNALFLHSLKNDMAGGRPTTKDDNAKVRWAFLREEEATVRDTSVYFDGLEYHSPFASSAGWYARAKHHGRFKIPVKRVRDWCNSIWHKTEFGEYVELKLKNINNESPWLNGHWEAVLHQLERHKDKIAEGKENARHLRAKKRTIQHEIRGEMYHELADAAPSERRTMQAGIKQRKEIQKSVNTLRHATELAKTFGGDSQGMEPESDDFNLDEQLYD
jgi:transposase InsO family protein